MVLWLAQSLVFAEPARSSTLTIHYHRFDGDYSNWGVWAWSKMPKNLPGASFAAAGQDDYGALIKVDLSVAATQIGFLLKKGDWQQKDIAPDRFATLASGKGEIWLVQGDSKVYVTRPEIKAGMHVWQDGAKQITVALDQPLKIVKGNSGFWLRQRGQGHYGPVEINKVQTLRTNASGEATVLELTAERSIEVDKLFFLEHDGYVAAKVYPRKVLDDKKYYYSGELGCAYSAKQSSFAVWAPTARALDVRIYDDAATDKYTVISMEAGKHGEWTASVKGDAAGKYYLFAVHFANPDISRDDDIVNLVLDPYARATSANSARCLIYNPDKVNGDVPGWSQDWYVPLKRNTDAVIYEMHTRDMSIDASSGVVDEYKGKYLGLVQSGTRGPANVSTTLDHLQELGITHAHLLPVNDYGVGDERQKTSQYDWYDWGYDPALYNNPEGSYATNADNSARQQEFKRMVQQFHSVGMGVICDVVYNHTYQTGEGQFSVFDKIIPYYYYRVDDYGGYYNGSGCGNDVASEKPMVRRFIVDSCTYWVSEYHVDGLRFDLMGLLDRETMLEVYKRVKQLNPSALIYGEGWDIPTGIPSDQRMTQFYVQNTGIASFNDGIRDNLKGDVFKQTEGSFIQGLPPYQGMDRLKAQIMGQSTGRGDTGILVATPNESVNYVSAHDNACIWDKLKYTNPKDTDEQIKRMDKFAAAIIFTAQGIPFYSEGDDFGRTKQGNDNSYDNNKPNINPVDWGLKNRNKDMFLYYKGLISLRKSHPAFRMDNKLDVDKSYNFIQKVPASVVAYTINGDAAHDRWRTILVVYNGSDKTIRIKKSGPWNIVVDDTHAGTDIIAQAKSTLLVAPLSALVAYKTVVDEDYNSVIDYVAMNDPYYGW